MTSYPVTLSALDGRDPLGFLAALGTLALLSDHHPDHIIALSFDEQTATAVLHSPHATLDAIAEALAETALQTAAGAVIPGLPPDFPPPMRQTGGDPTRVARPHYRALVAQLAHTDIRAPTSRWLSALVTDLAADNNGRVALTPYTAPMGKQSLRSFFEKPLTETRNQPHRIREALDDWRRVDTVTGENFDHRALRNAADQPDGRSQPAGVPGATWLATMALPLLRLTGDGSRRAATCWHRLSSRRAEIMIWPIWRQPLDVYGVQALLEHPALQPDDRNGTPSIELNRLRPLGVVTVAAAGRQPLPKSDGVLVPTAVELRHLT